VTVLPGSSVAISPEDADPDLTSGPVVVAALVPAVGVGGLLRHLLRRPTERSAEMTTELSNFPLLIRH